MKICDILCDHCQKVIGDVFGDIQCLADEVNPRSVCVKHNGVKLTIRGDSIGYDFCNYRCLTAFFEIMNQTTKAQTPGMTLTEAARVRIANALAKVERGVCWLQRMVTPFRLRPIDGNRYIEKITIHEDGREESEWWLKKSITGGEARRIDPPFGSMDERSAVWRSRPLVLIHDLRSRPPTPPPQAQAPMQPGMPPQGAVA